MITFSLREFVFVFEWKYGWFHILRQSCFQYACVYSYVYKSCLYSKACSPMLYNPIRRLFFILWSTLLQWTFIICEHLCNKGRQYLQEANEAVGIHTYLKRKRTARKIHGCGTFSKIYFIVKIFLSFLLKICQLLQEDIKTQQILTLCVVFAQ